MSNLVFFTAFATSPKFSLQKSLYNAANWSTIWNVTDSYFPALCQQSFVDQPWSDGNPIRSALGRKVGRTSVPAIFIDGVYIGGCEDGPSDAAPGLVPLAFQGK